MTTAALSFASFTRGQGGWQIGEKLGSLSEEQVRSLLEAVPTQLGDGTAIPSYPDRSQRAHLVRRYAWLPAPWDPRLRVFFASVPAGPDATGRPGNVFTYVAVTADTRMPVAALHSPDIPTPFGPRETEAARIPEWPQASGPVAELIPVFLDGWDDEESPLPEAFTGISNSRRRDMVAYLAAALGSGQSVVLAAPSAESTLWVAAVAAAGIDFCFSTIERTTSVADTLARGARLVIIPPQDLERVRAQHADLTVLATTDEVPAAPVPEPKVPDLGTALANPFASEAPEPAPLRADLAEQWEEVSAFLAQQGPDSHLTVGLALSPSPRQAEFLRRGEVTRWVHTLSGEEEDPLTVPDILGFLLFPPTSFIGARTRAMVLAAEALKPGCSHVVTVFGWLFDAPADIEEQICADAAAQLPTNRRFAVPQDTSLPVNDLLERIVAKHNDQVLAQTSWMHTHKNQVRN
ncbi:MAG: hypothetical protein Q4G50_02040 [Corynebacterium sp.]|uniref:GAP1-N2 domain-containing protein n=1 Tax=Corynebacterium sp. TaxID=1720 RepID=UPI0026DEB50B|nr:hypothetical protein [Corynebacterium sp.]MDO5668763.1 hypothetical protein [Corynebacterium sp.]